ncbi:MAG: AbrB/MazE/SpoVT family DNA-binding domain-containing protein [Nanoarchaeota archaeon]
METKIVKVTGKGQISIPVEIRKSIGISVGDELIAVRDGETLCLKKIQKDDFKDLLRLTEISLGKFWDNKEDEIWDNYLK